MAEPGVLLGSGHLGERGKFPFSLFVLSAGKIYTIKDSVVCRGTDYVAVRCSVCA